jgi:phytoene synthase
LTPDQYCEQKVAQSGSSFYYSFLFLPAPRRRAIIALYAFCREVDDIVDGDPMQAASAEVPVGELAHVRLAWWREEIARTYAGTPSHPVTQALAPHVSAYQLPADNLLAILDGMEMDLRQSRYLDFAGLRQYCYRVAGVVGLLSARIFGCSQPATLEYAERLGLALQLINIIRDVGEDARNGRIYLPMEDLQRFSVPAADLMQARYSDAYRDLMRFQAQRARTIYRDALAQLPPSDRRAQRAGLIMGAIYATLLDEIEASDFEVLHQRIALTPIRKLWIASKTSFMAR